jgi:hypothetical protein
MLQYISVVPWRALQQVQRLQRRVKRESKGAAREIHQDAVFLARAEREKFQKRQAERDAKFKEVVSFLEHQQATHKEMVKKGIAQGAGRS